MDSSFPPKLYKYQSLLPKSHTLDNLRRCRIWFSRPQELNDPFDCSIAINYSKTDEEVLDFFKVYLDDLHADGKSELIPEEESRYLTNGRPNSALKDLVNTDFEKHDRKRVKQYGDWGVACFTREVGSIIMWSHYADGHRGICLEFDTNYFPFLDRNKLHEVIYSDAYPVLSVMDAISRRERFIEPVKTKFTTWSYEKEWRMIMDHGGLALQYEPKALTGIYFGCAMPDNQKQLIAAMPARSAARLYSMKRSATEFKLEVVPYIN